VRALTGVLVAALLAAPAGAVRPITVPAPEFPAGAAWINAKPLTLSLLRGRKVIVVAFLNPTGLHSIRILPALKAWFDRYAMSQLMVIGVVTPDLDVQKDAAWLKAELKRQGVEFPVVIDGERKLWKAYSNEGWPAIFLIDRKGRLIFDHLGEGGYEEFEKEMRDALSDLTDPLPAAINPPEPRRKDCGPATPDVAMGSRGRVRPIALDNDTSRHTLLVESRQGELATHGKWDSEPDGVRLAQANADQGGFVRVVYEASQAMAVLAPSAPGKKTRFFIKQDDQWLYEGITGADVRIDDDGRSFIVVEQSRLYDLAHDTGDRPHELYVIPETKGGGVYGFSFADACTATKLP
jgi:hypothetical protein